MDSLPELIVEILSPCTVHTDRFQKLNSYEKAGVPHYWLVDPSSSLIECYKLQDQHYIVLTGFSLETFIHPDLPGLSFEIEQLFRAP